MGRVVRNRARRMAGRMGALLRCERAFWDAGVLRLAGVDEAGVGPLAGPVVAAAVVLLPRFRVRGIDDSKRLPAGERERLAAEIRAGAAGVGVGIVEVEDIDRLNIYHAGLLAMQRAVEALPDPPEQVLVDGRVIPGIALPQVRMVKGDQRSYSIAAASILAKVTRDALMMELDGRYPVYGFARHKGYPTADHRAAIVRWGPCPVHRRSFSLLPAQRLPGL